MLSYLKHGNERGAALLEMAIVIPLLVLLAFGTIETSYLLMQQNNVRSAAREGARMAATSNVHSTDLAAFLCPGLSEDLRVEASKLATSADVFPGGTGYIEISGPHTPLLGFMFEGARLYARLEFTVEMNAEPGWWNNGGAQCT